MRLKKRKEKSYTLARLGKIKVGFVTKAGYPTSTDYFIFDGNSNQYSNAMLQSLKKNGLMDSDGKVRRLEITFPSNDISYVCPNYLELRDGGGKLYVKGDGETFDIAVPQKMGTKMQTFTKEQILTKYDNIEQFKEAMLVKARKGANKPQQINWREKLTLRFVVLGTPIIGEWELTTGGVETSIEQMVSVIDSSMEMNKDENGNPTLFGLAFDLSIKKVVSNRMGDNRKYPVLSLVPKHPDMIQSVSNKGFLKGLDVLNGNEQLLIGTSNTAPIEQVENQDIDINGVTDIDYTELD